MLVLCDMLRWYDPSFVLVVASRRLVVCVTVGLLWDVDCVACLDCGFGLVLLRVWISCWVVAG